MSVGLSKKVLNFVGPWVRLDTFGLDISDLTVKYAKFRPGKETRLENFGEIKIPAGIIENGEIRKEAELEKVFSDWLRRDGRKFRSAFAVVSLPEEKGFLRLIQIPKIKRDEIANAIRWEIESNVPLPLEELIYDYDVVEPPDSQFDHLDVAISAFPKKVIESYLRVLKGAGIKVMAMEVESQAITRSLLPSLQRGAKIIADIGHARTGIAIFAGGTLVYTTTVNFGGKVLEENLVRHLNLSPQQAAALKKEKGLDRRAAEGKILPAVLPALSTLSDELKKTIVFYQTHAKHIHQVEGVIDEIILVGGDANLPGLTTYLSSALKVKTNTGDFLPVLSGAEFPIPALPRDQSLAYATAIGLALRK